MRIITFDDYIDTYSKFKERGVGFLLSKGNLSGVSRTKSTFDRTDVQSSNWWIIPKVIERWNEKISGNKDVNYRQYLLNDYFHNQSGLKLLSLGSGTCSHELELAEYPQFEQIICVDFAQSRLQEAETLAKKRNLSQVQFICSTVKNYQFPEDNFDVILFNMSLHHFRQVEQLLKNKVWPSLKNNGKLIINEYVGPNRLQFPKKQLRAINKALRFIPEEYRKRFKSNVIKNRYYGSGLVRMVLADPSECVESQNILPAVHDNFKTIIEKPYGGNILVGVLKDISHHFVKLNSEKEEILNKLFLFEDEYLKNNPSDFIFGLYEK